VDNSADDTSAKSHTLFQDRPAPNTPRFPIPEVVREIGAEDPVQQVVEVLIPPALEFGDIDPNLLGARGKICRCAQWNNRRL